METFFGLVVPSIVAYLTQTIKNKDSKKAQQIRKYVQQVNDITTQFLASFPAK